MRDERKKQPNTNYSRGGRNDDEARRPVYHISIVAEMVETHPQTLRMYERMGLIAPRRTRNNVRLYSDADVEQVRRIQYLTQDLGVNLAGVEVIFNLLREMQRLRTGTADHDDYLSAIPTETDGNGQSELRRKKQGESA